MTMVIAVKNEDNIIMTADKRITIQANTGEAIIINDNYKKIKIFDNKFIVSFAGRNHIAEQAFIYIEQNIEKLNNTKPSSFFRDAFNHGKSCFEHIHPNAAPTSIFFLGYMLEDTPILLGFSSDDNYQPIQLDATVKAHATSSEAEQILFDETVSYINSEINSRNFESLKEVAEMYYQAIKRVDDIMIGKTAYSIILTSHGIEEINHS